MNEKLHTLGLSVLDDLQRSLTAFSVREMAFGRAVGHPGFEWQSPTIAAQGLAAAGRQLFDLQRVLYSASVPEDLVADREISGEATQTHVKRVAPHSWPLEDYAQLTATPSSKLDNQKPAPEFSGPGLAPAVRSRKNTGTEQQSTFGTSQADDETYPQMIDDPEPENADTATSTTPDSYSENYPNSGEDNNDQTVQSQFPKSESAFTALGKLADLAGAYEQEKSAGSRPSTDASAKARQPEIVEVSFFDTDKEPENAPVNRVESRPGKTPAKDRPTLDANDSDTNRTAFSKIEQFENSETPATETLLEALTRKLQNDYERFYGD